MSEAEKAWAKYIEQRLSDVHPSNRKYVRRHKEDFIAGYQARDAEIDRLRAGIRKIQAIGKPAAEHQIASDCIRALWKIIDKCDDLLKETPRD